MIKLDSDNSIKRFNLGEIFEITSKFLEEEDGKIIKEETFVTKMFFVKVGHLFYLFKYNGVNDFSMFADEDGNYSEISGIPYQGSVRKSNNPFTYEEVIQFLQSRNPVASNKFVWKTEPQVTDNYIKKSFKKNNNSKFKSAEIKKVEWSSNEWNDFKISFDQPSFEVEPV